MTRSAKLLLASSLLAAAVLAGAPRAAKAVRDFRTARRNALIDQAQQALARGEDSIDWSVLRDPDEAPAAPGARRGAENDDARLRQLANEALWGRRSPEFTANVLRIAQAEMARWSAPAARGAIRPAIGPAAPAPAGTRTWRNLGPANARSEWNGSYYNAVDSGRPTAISVDDANGVVYLATSGGGVWSTSNLASPTPTWAPLTDGLGILAVGAMDIVPGASSATTTIWLGMGDAFDQKGGVLLGSMDGGQTWPTSILLKAAQADGLVRAASSVRDLRVDPNATKIIFAATDVGLFKVDLTTASPTVTIVALPNKEDATGALYEEATWSIAFTGTSGTGKSSFVVSGVQAAAPNSAPPQAGYGTATTYGDLWTSADGGATWTSARTAGTLPAVGTTAGTLPAAPGRMAVGAGNPVFGATTLYVQVGAVDESAQVGILKSTNSGASWTVVATNAATNLNNPTLSSTDCNDLNVAHGQVWYNQAIAVDPTNNNNAYLGGNLCAVRTTDGGATWSNVSHWLPSGGGGSTANGPLPYVHADWHAARAIRTGTTRLAGAANVVLSFAGTDGGFFMSTNLFSAGKPEQVAWTQPDAGIVTHLHYGIASGEFASGNPTVVFSGLQDNGTRWRENELNGGTFDQIIGGDGIGTAIATDPNGQNPFLFASVEFGRFYCNPRRRQCGNATFNDPSLGDVPNWLYVDATPLYPTACTPSATQSCDGDPFLVRFAATHDPASSVLTASIYNVLRLTVDQNDNYTYTPLTNNTLSPANPAPMLQGRQIRGLGVHVAPGLYNVGGASSRVYGVDLTGGKWAVGVDSGASVAWTLTGRRVQTPTGTLSYTNSIAFPHDPSHLGGGADPFGTGTIPVGSDIRQTYAVSIVAPAYNSGAAIEATVGHVFFTTDGGTHWVPLVGNHTGADLPNVPVSVVKFDPDDASDQTIWAGTDLGVYRSTDGGQTWARYGGASMPAVRVTDLAISANGTLVRAATYGRGLWEVVPGSEPRAGVLAKGDFDRSGVIDFSNVIAAAARLSFTPSTAAAPGLGAYDWSLDTDANGTINATDLTAITTKFGSTP